MRLNGTQRLLVAVAFTVITLVFFWPPYRDALRRLNDSLLTNVSSDDAQMGDDEPPADRRWRHCTGPIGASNRQCGPWHYGAPPWEDR